MPDPHVTKPAEMSADDLWLRRMERGAVPLVPNEKRGRLGFTIPVWDCFARLNLVTPALTPSSPCHPTRPDDADVSGVFQDAPSFCHFRPLRNFGVRFLAPHEIGNEMRCRLLVSGPYAVVRASNWMNFVARMMERYAMTV